MKTKNNVQKTILRSVAVVVSFVLISFTVSAQDFWKKLLTNSSFNEIAIAMSETSKRPNNLANNKTKPAGTITWDEASDKNLALEDWMTNDKYFAYPVFRIHNVVENNLGLENWMLNENLFEVNNELEDQLKLENWMTSDKVWNM